MVITNAFHYHLSIFQPNYDHVCGLQERAIDVTRFIYVVYFLDNIFL